MTAIFAAKSLLSAQYKIPNTVSLKLNGSVNSAFEKALSLSVVIFFVIHFQNPSFTLEQQQQPPRISVLNPNFSLQSSRTYISEMRRSAFEGNLLRLVRNEIRCELDRSPVSPPVTKFESFLVDDRPGEQWISLSRKFGDKEDIKVEATMIDGALRDPKSSGGAVAREEDVSLHITLIINISKEGSDNVLEFVCSAWSDCLEVDKLSIRKSGNMSIKPYDGPEYKDLDDQLVDAIHEYLEERGINDKLAAFVHDYAKNKDKTEFIRWMETVKSFIEKK